MTTLINLPHEIQAHISNFLRPYRWTGDYHFGPRGRPEQLMRHTMEIDPFSKAPGVASIKAVHRNFNKVSLWKNREWKEHIRKWRDENLTKMRWKYQYGTLPDKMIKMGWEYKINKQYRSQDCYVKTTFGKAVGTGFVEDLKMYKVIWFEVSLYDLVTGVRPLPHCFGNDGSFHRQADNGSLQIDASIDFVPKPTLETLIPVEKRREWLIECFKECILKYWNIDTSTNFMKNFKKIMDIPLNYELSQETLFDMFLRELSVCSKHVKEKEGYFKRTHNIAEILENI